MSKLALSGVLLGLFALLISSYFRTGEVGFLFNAHAFFIVMGGTIGAVMLQTPYPVFVRALKYAHVIFKNEQLDLRHEINKIIRWSHLSKKEGTLVLEDLALKEKSPLIRKGLSAISQGIPTVALKRILETEMEGQTYHALQAASVFESMGGYAPTIGIVGAVLGLIEVMRHLSNPAELGGGIALAFIATLYGVGFANLLFIPLANNIKSQVDHLQHYHEMMSEGLLAIADNLHPDIIEQTLQGYLEK